MAYKRIMDIQKFGWESVQVEFFDMKHNHYGYAKRKIRYTPKHPTMEGYINWERSKKDVSALLR